MRITLVWLYTRTSYEEVYERDDSCRSDDWPGYTPGPVNNLIMMQAAPEIELHLTRDILLLI